MSRFERDGKKNGGNYDFRALRNVPLELVIEACGGARAKGSTARAKHQYFVLDGREWTIDAVENTWAEKAGASAGGGAIDYLMSARGLSMREARDWLHERWGSTTSDCRTAAASALPTPPIFSRPAAVELPVADPKAWPEVRRYLVLTRGLDADLVDALHKAGDLYGAASKGYKNAVFRTGAHSCLCRGIWDPPPPRRAFKQTIGAAMPLVIGDGSEAWVVEGPVTALSLVCLISDVRVIALAGRAVNPERSSALRNAIGDRSVVVATDADRGGDEIAERLIATYPEAARVLPWSGHNDWNRVLLDRQS